ncbi:hypothetical protein VUN82_00395 [Micrococcaceae bacterium Sec5.1]
MSTVDQAGRETGQGRARDQPRGDQAWDHGASEYEANDDKAPLAPRPRRSTSPLLWTGAVGALLVLLLLRSQQLHSTVAAKVAETGAAKELTDPAMAELSVNIGFYLGVVISGVLAAVYFSLASVAESTFFPGFSKGRGRFRVGVLGTVAIVSLLSVQLMSLLLTVASPKDHWLTFAYVGLVGLGVPWMFRQQWNTTRRPAVLFAASLAIAAVSLAL